MGISSGSQPDFYMGFLEGSLRMMPAWQWVVFGHTFAFNVFIPALLPLGLIMTGAALWPFIEQWVTGDRREHHLNDRPRNAPTRTAIGMTAVAFYGVLWAEGANDVIADHLDIPLYTITWIARFSIFLVPWFTYIITKRICLGLQRADLHTLEHGVETGIIRQLPTGEFIEVTEAPTDEERAVLLARPDYPELPAAGEPAEGVPAPRTRGAVGRLRERAYKVVTESVPLDDACVSGPGNGHAIEGGNGRHGNGHAPAASAAPATVPPGAAEGERGEQPGAESLPDQGEDH